VLVVVAIIRGALASSAPQGSTAIPQTTRIVNNAKNFFIFFASFFP
jgi:hypothetical protein